MDIIPSLAELRKWAQRYLAYKQTLPGSAGDVSISDQLCSGISLQKPEELERLSKTEVCQIRKKKGLYTQLLFVHFYYLYYAFL